MTSKPGVSLHCSGNNGDGGNSRLLSMWCPVHRWRDSMPGSGTELENLVGDDKGKGTSGSPARPKVPIRRTGAHCPVVAGKRGNTRGAKGTGQPGRDGVNEQSEELLVLTEGGSLLWVGTSRMNREVHVRICERLGVKIPGPTRRCDQSRFLLRLEWQKYVGR